MGSDLRMADDTADPGGWNPNLLRAKAFGKRRSGRDGSGPMCVTSAHGRGDAPLSRSIVCAGIGRRSMS